jgi:hypothetical protein
MTFKSIFNNEHMTKELEQLYKKANCTDSPSEWFFPAIQKGRPSEKPGSNLYKAYSVCADCTVKKECLNFAVKYKCIGVWGGKLFSDNKRHNATKIKHTK